MRELVIQRLAHLIQDADGYGIPAYFDCSEEDHITDAADLQSKTDAELLDILEVTVGFQG